LGKLLGEIEVRKEDDDREELLRLKLGNSLRAMKMPETTEDDHLVYNKGLGFSHGL
jgi:hypothetical protein